MESYENVKETVKNILNKKIGIKEDLLIPENDEEPLTGGVFGISALELVMLLFEIERMYKIRIDQEDLLQYKFSTIKSVVNVVMNYIN